jgi:hypothetical protein
VKSFTSYKWIPEIQVFGMNVKKFTKTMWKNVIAFVLRFKKIIWLSFCREPFVSCLRMKQRKTPKHKHSSVSLCRCARS